MISDQDAISMVKVLERKVEEIERRLDGLQGKGGRGIMYGDLDMNGHRCVRAAPSNQRDDYVIHDELDEVMSSFEVESPTSTGTSHTLAFEVKVLTSGVPSIWGLLNGVSMMRGSTGQNGFTFTAPSTITTIRSIIAADTLTLMYSRAYHP